MRSLWIAVLVVGLGCAPVPGATPVREIRVHTDRRVARENRALRREVRALRRELEQTRSVAETEAEARRRDGEVQSAIVAGLAEQIQVLARTIGELEQALRAQNRVEAAASPPARGKGGRDRFGKLRVGSVPAQSPTPPEPRGRMDQPDLEVRPPDLLDPFSKAPAPQPESLR